LCLCFITFDSLFVLFLSLLTQYDIACAIEPNLNEKLVYIEILYYYISLY